MRLTLLEPTAPLMCPANRLQQYWIGSDPSVIEDNGTIAMGKFGPVAAENPIHTVVDEQIG
jgi:hypothetical protein